MYQESELSINAMNDESPPAGARRSGLASAPLVCRTVIRSILVTGLVGICFKPVAARAAEQAIPASIRACAAERDSGRRLACFDAAVAAAPDALPATAPDAKNAPATAVFGLPESPKPKRQPQEIQATVKQVDVRPHGELVVTLDDGQVWTEVAAQSGIRVKAGDSVRIGTGSLGSFRLYAANGRSAPVKRMR